MAKKIDLSGMKEFFFNHGEKVALGACGFIALSLGLWGLISALGAGKATNSTKSFAEDFKERANQIRQQIAGAPKPQVKPIDTKDFAWVPYISKHIESPYAAFSEQEGDKRRNPQVLPIKNDPGTMRIDYIPGLTFRYETDMPRTERVLWGIDAEGATAPAPMPPPTGKKKGAPVGPVNLPTKGWVHVPVATRMVVVQGIFPMKQQVEEFRRAFKMNDQSDMFKKDRDDLPQPLGLDIYRHEVPGKGEPAKDPEKLMLFENGQLYVMPSLETFLRQAIYEEKVPEGLEDYIFAGLATPMPKLGNRLYPRITFPGFDPDWTALDQAEKEAFGPRVAAAATGTQPTPPPPITGFKFPPKKKPPMPMPQPADPKPVGALKRTSVTERELQSVLPSLAGRLWPGKEKDIEKDFNPYHVLGNLPWEGDMPPAKNVPVGGKGPATNPLERYFTPWEINPPEAQDVAPDPKTKKAAPAAGAPFPNWDRDAYVRFIDVGVVPGKTYYYSVRVRMKNPNYKKENVAFQALASNPELPPSAWVETPQVKVPEEYHLYAIDQQIHDEWAADGKGLPKNFAFPPSIVNILNNYTSFQIHQWNEKKNDIRGGAESFVIGDWVIAGLKFGQYVRRGNYIGRDVIVQIPVWKQNEDRFEIPKTQAPPKEKNNPDGIHVDLTLKDGRAPVLVDFTGGKKLTRLNTLEEEIAVDALILMPDGSLKVLNSREASDAAAYREARERQERVVEVQRTIDRIKGIGNPNKGVPGAK